MYCSVVDTTTHVHGTSEGFLMGHVLDKGNLKKISNGVCIRKNQAKAHQTIRGAGGARQ